MLSGLIAAQVINFAFNPPKEQVEPMQFFKGKRKRKKKAAGGGIAFAHSLDRAAARAGVEIITLPPGSDRTG